MITVPAAALSVIVIILPPAPGGPQVVPAPSGLTPAASAPSAADNRGRPLLGLGVGGDSLAAVDLAGWKLTVPEVSEKGTAASVNPADGGAGPWLTRDQHGVRLWTPVDGATTPNSTHTRTELVSRTHWQAGTGKHTLRASVTVSQVPTEKQDVIIGQVHGADDISSVSFVMLHYAAGAIGFVVKQGQSGPTADKYPLISGVPLGAPFEYMISDTGDGHITCTATYGDTRNTATTTIPDTFRSATVRFQAGAYQQAVATNAAKAGGSGNTPGSEDGAQVTFQALRETHAGATGAANG